MFGIMIVNFTAKSSESSSGKNLMKYFIRCNIFICTNRTLYGSISHTLRVHCIIYSVTFCIFIYFNLKHISKTDYMTHNYTLNFQSGSTVAGGVGWSSTTISKAGFKEFALRGAAGLFWPRRKVN